MEHSLIDILVHARTAAEAQVFDPRERAIVVRYIEDAMCRVNSFDMLTELKKTKG